MADSYTTSLTFNITTNTAWDFENALDHSVTHDRDNARTRVALTEGQGVGQADEMWSDRRTLTPSTPADALDFSSVEGVEPCNVFGRAVHFVKVKVLYVFNRGVPDGSGGWTPTQDHDLILGGNASAWSSWMSGVAADEMRVHSGGSLTLVAPNTGYSIGQGSDILDVTLDGAATSDVEYDLVIVGTIGPVV